MSILGTTNITASSISNIFYVPDINGNVDVYIPITASSLSDECYIELVGEGVESWCTNVSILYATYQPQGNVWFAHVLLSLYQYDETHPELEDRSVTLILHLKTNESEEEHVITHVITQKGCAADEGEMCEFESVVPASSLMASFSQDCSLTDDILSDDDIKSHVLTQDC